MKYCFVILHYKTHKDTIDCVESIKGIKIADGDSCRIIIVDNASANGSVEILEERYKSDERVIFLKNTENMGFARGNNVGYAYAKNKEKADFILILNNDIIVKSTDILDKIKDSYEKNSFHIMGPDIVSMVDNNHQNPPCPTSTDLRAIKKDIIKFRLLILLSKLGIYDLLKKAKNKPSNKKSEVLRKKPQPAEGAKLNCQLHGAFLIYSPLYIEKEKYAFYPGTFLYCEEPILYQHCVKKSYVTFFNPDIVVLHKEDSSTSFVNNSTKKKREFVFKHLIKSRKEYIKYLKDDSVWR